jgi:hypothetical protein
MRDTCEGLSSPVPNMGFERKSSAVVSSEGELQILDLAVTGSNPVPPVGLSPTARRGCKTYSDHLKPKGGGRWLDRPSPRLAAVKAALENTLQDADSVAALARQRRVNETTDGS